MNDRLALFHMAEDPDDYWAAYWERFDWVGLRNVGGFSALGELAGPFRDHLNPGRPVIEAGCGTGRIVAALAEEGFDVLGVERSPKVVEQIGLHATHLTVQCGDVEALDFSDGTYGGYVSLGVVEHNSKGPMKALSEARRVLDVGGIALISVPYLNPLRQRHLARIEPNQVARKGLYFHQYYFSRSELLNIIQGSGFTVVEFFPYAVEAFLTREHPLFSRLWNSPLFRERMKKFWRRRFRTAGSVLRWRYAHMLLFVCEAV